LSVEENNILLDGILKQAELDSHDILQKAEKTIEEKTNALEAGISRIKSEMDSKIAAKLSELEKRADSAVKAELRRQNLRNRKKVNSAVNKSFYEKIEEQISTDQYNNFLIKLIAEGAIAVNDDSPVVSCSFREKVTDDVLSEAERLIETKTGKKIKLGFVEETKLSGQGIVVESSNGRIAYNNQIKSRLRRFDEDIKMIIINGLAKE